MTLLDALWYFQTTGGLRLLWINSCIFSHFKSFWVLLWHSDIFETRIRHYSIPSFIFPFIKYLTSTIGFTESNLITTQKWRALVVSWIQKGVSTTLYHLVKRRSTISWDVLVSMNQGQGGRAEGYPQNPSRVAPCIPYPLWTTFLPPSWLSVSIPEAFLAVPSFCPAQFSPIESEFLRSCKSYSLHSCISGELTISPSPSNQEACFRLKAHPRAYVWQRHFILIHKHAVHFLTQIIILCTCPLKWEKCM